MLEPTLQQRSALNDIQGPLALVQFLAIQDQDAFGQYLLASASTVQEAGGQRTHILNIDQYLAGGEMGYQAITVYVFPSNKAALSAFETTSSERRAAQHRKGPVPETIAVLKKHDQTTPFFMMNLNKYYLMA